MSIKITTLEIQNTIFKGFKERVTDPDFSSIDPLDQPLFIHKPGFSNIMFKSSFKELSSHKLVNAKTSDSYPHITSFAFTKKAFFNKAWDTINVKARGLFVNNQTLEIASRSYCKFFNYLENADHTKEALQQKLAFPVDVYIKENGYLGIIGYDSQTDQLLITSKSTPEGDFAENFKQIFWQTVSVPNQHRIKKYLKDQQVSLVFEVIDPVFDPHMIEYDQQKIILLDIIARSEVFLKASYDQVVTFAKQFGFEYKKRYQKFTSWEKLEGFIKNVVADTDFTGESGKQVEGYVFEDSQRFQFKLKANFYSQWKYMRSVKDKVARLKENSTEIKKESFNLEGLQFLFLEYVEKQTVDYLKKDIISIRKDFLKEYQQQIEEYLQATLLKQKQIQ